MTGSMKVMLLSLLLPTIAHGISFGIGPSVRYMIPRSSSLSEVESVGYQESVSRILFCEKGLLLFGVRINAAVSESCNAVAEGYWRGYDPCYVTVDSAAQYDTDRSGRLAVYSIGMEKQLGSWKAKVLAEGTYFRESWSNPYTGARETHDSLAIGPVLLIGMDINICPGTLSYDMGLSFPALTDVVGRISLSYLLP